MTRSFVDCLLRLWMFILHIFPIKRNKIVFKSDRGANCSDSPYALFDAFQHVMSDLDYVWILNDSSKTPTGSRCVRNGSLAEIYELATAKLWVDNKRKGNWCVKRKGQFYIQTWHGAFALKKIEKDIEEKLPASYIRSCKRDSAMADWFLSGSAWTNKLYRSSFYYSGEILEYGVPRADILHQDPKKFHQKICKYFNLQSDAKIALYAPTFRDNQDFSMLGFDANRVLDSLQQRWPGNWALIIRLHPNITKEANKISYSERILNGSDYPLINEQIIASDLLITDYSSCMFDAMEALKPVLLYCPDIEEYQESRGTYFDVDELPFENYKTMDEFCTAIAVFDLENYYEKVRNFMNKLGFFQRPRSSYLICEEVSRRIGLK